MQIIEILWNVLRNATWKMHYIFRFYQVELDIPLEEQGPFDLIIQKVPDYLGKAVGKELGKDEALQMLQGIKVSKGWSVRKVIGGGGEVRNFKAREFSNGPSLIYSYNSQLDLIKGILAHCVINNVRMDHIKALWAKI